MTGYNAGIYVEEGSTLTITGDSRDDILTANGRNGGSGIGGYVLNSSPYTSIPHENILITNVTVNARGSVEGMGSYAPGIGNAGSTTGTITIDNAIVHAYGCEQGYTIGRVSTPGIGCGKHWHEGVPSSVPAVTIRNQSEVHTQIIYAQIISDGCLVTIILLMPTAPSTAAMAEYITAPSIATRATRSSTR